MLFSNGTDALAPPTDPEEKEVTMVTPATQSPTNKPVDITYIQPDAAARKSLLKIINSMRAQEASKASVPFEKSKGQDPIKCVDACSSAVMFTLKKIYYQDKEVQDKPEPNHMRLLKATKALLNNTYCPNDDNDEIFPYDEINRAKIVMIKLSKTDPTKAFKRTGTNSTTVKSTEGSRLWKVSADLLGQFHPVNVKKTSNQMQMESFISSNKKAVATGNRPSALKKGRDPSKSPQRKDVIDESQLSKGGPTDPKKLKAKAILKQKKAAQAKATASTSTPTGNAANKSKDDDPTQGEPSQTSKPSNLDSLLLWLPSLSSLSSSSMSTTSKATLFLLILGGFLGAFSA